MLRRTGCALLFGLCFGFSSTSSAQTEGEPAPEPFAAASVDSGFVPRAEFSGWIDLDYEDDDREDMKGSFNVLDLYLNPQFVEVSDHVFPHESLTDYVSWMFWTGATF